MSVKHEYNQITRIENQYRNIVIGDGISIDSLDCGFYSREFETMVPENYITRQSPSIPSGNRESGTTYVDYTRYYGSRVPQYFRLDDQRTTTMAIVPQEAAKAVAADELAAQLYQFLAASLATFSITGFNYPAVQQGINNSIPTLLVAFHLANQTLQETALVLAQKQQAFENADDDFKAGLSLWLPLFFLIPGGLALLAYMVISYFTSAQTSETTTADAGEWDDTAFHPTAFKSSSA